MQNFPLILNSLKWALQNVSEKSYRQKTKQIAVLRFHSFAVFPRILPTFAITVI
jgi:hypothetical protein